MISSLDSMIISEEVTYSYGEGILDILKIIAVVSIFALISVIISLIIGIRKKDCIAILTGNIMVKTIVVFLYQVLDEIWLYFSDAFMSISFFTISIIIEGIIYNKVLKYKKYNGMIVSLICNISTVIISFLIIFIFGSGFKRLLDLLL